MGDNITNTMKLKTKLEIAFDGEGLDLSDDLTYDVTPKKRNIVKFTEMSLKTSRHCKKIVDSSTKLF